MVDLHTFLLFMAGALALNLTPGPDMAFVLAQATRGTRAGLTAALGVGVGCLWHVTMATLGLAALLAAYPLAFDVVRYAGAAYLVWIAVGLLRHPPHLNGGAARTNAAVTFRQGIVTSITNPKVTLFFVAFLPQFVVPGPTAWMQFLLLGLAFNISGTAVDCLVALSGGTLTGMLRRNPLFGRLIGWLSASVMFALALRLAMPEKR